MKDFELCVNPVEDYQVPEIPTFEEDNSRLLKKLPTRWQKCAKVIAGIGLVGMLALSRCGNRAGEFGPHYINHNLGYTHGSYRGFSEGNLLVRLHTGGMGSSFYMAHLTEQEAFGIIRGRLEAAGLSFDVPPAASYFEREEDNSTFDRLLGMRRSDIFDFELFDAQRGVAIVNARQEHRFLCVIEQEIIRITKDTFAADESDIMVGIFYNPRRVVGGHRAIIPSLIEMANARPVIVRAIINQADIFIARLQLEGTLERFPDVDIIINGTPFNHGEQPIIINNQVMVPASELFAALAMDVVVDVNESRLAIIATQNDLEIWVASWGGMFITRSDIYEIPEDMRIFVHNDIISVPLQYIANLTGASVAWDEATRTITISQ
ncbi:MAG: hypothetical protein FWE42_07020 [Defluviitaleaceae bacterium]|nr:hypothetical protein [Defluviitaleaceae bacterium]